MSSKYTQLGDRRAKQVKSQRTQMRKGNVLGVEDAMGKFQSRHDLRCMTICGMDFEKWANIIMGGSDAKSEN